MNQHEYTISYLKQAFKRNLTNTIEQATKYCIDNGVSYGVISNGAEWLVLPLIETPGVAFDNMKGVYFGNIFSDDFYFDHFWNLLSKESVRNGELDECLNELNYSQSEVCKIIKSDYGVLKWSKPDRDKYIDEFYESFFSQITESNQLKMLEYCFVADSKLSQYKGDLKRILRDQKPNFFPSNAEDLDPGESQSAILDNSNSGKVIIVAGSVGCGKSTLVKKSLIEAKINQKSSITPIFVDLIYDVDKNIKNPKELIFEKVSRNIKESYPWINEYENLLNVFKDEIKTLKNGPKKKLFESHPEKYIESEANLLEELISNKEDFIIKAAKEITRQRNNVIIIIDNVDRASEVIQEEVYTLACKISSLSGSIIIITMREFTYFKNKNKGFLDVRPSDRVIHLKAPDFGTLISKRLRYIEQHLDEDFRVPEWRRKYDLEQFKIAVYKYKDVLKNSLQLSSDGPKILQTLSSISWHNIRLFYDLLKRVHMQLGSSKEIWTNPETITALMISKEISEGGIIPNIFIPYQNINKSYFLKLRLLMFLNYSIKSNEKTHGVPKRRILAHLKMYGYKQNWILNAIEESVRQRLLECLEAPSDADNIYEFEVKEGVNFRISPLGLTFLSEITGAKIYLSLISADLPFHSTVEFEQTKAEYDLVFSYMGETGKNIFYKDAIDIVENSKLSFYVVRYLLRMYKDELPNNKIFNSLSEISLCEDKIKRIFPKELLIDESNKPNSKAKQLELLPYVDEENEDNKEHLVDVSLILPKGIDINGMKFNGTEFIPLILCALVIQLLSGKEHSFGIDITNCINNYLVNPDNAKFTNNVSRALRSKKILNQKWLNVRKDVHPKYKAFSLSENWLESWEDIFGTPFNNQLLR